MLIKMEKDILNISNRLRDINRDYRVFYNNRFNRFEIHNREEPTALSLCFIVPFEQLDTRVLDYANKTRVENFDALELQHDSQNREIESSAYMNALVVQKKLEDMMRFAGDTIEDVTFYKNKLWI